MYITGDNCRILRFARIAQGLASYIYIYTYVYTYEYTVNPRHEAEWNRRIEEEEVEEDEESLRKIVEARMGQMEGREKEGW